MIRQHVTTYEVHLEESRLEILIDMVVRLVLSHVMQPDGAAGRDGRDDRLDRRAGPEGLSAARLGPAWAMRQTGEDSADRIFGVGAWADQRERVS